MVLPADKKRAQEDRRLYLDKFEVRLRLRFLPATLGNIENNRFESSLGMQSKCPDATPDAEATVLHDTTTGFLE